MKTKIKLSILTIITILCSIFIYHKYISETYFVIYNSYHYDEQSNEYDLISRNDTITVKSESLDMIDYYVYEKISENYEINGIDSIEVETIVKIIL